MPGRPLALARQITKTAGIPNGMRTGIVVKVDATGVTVNIAGGEVLCGLQGNSVGIAPGAVVNVFRQDSSWVVQGVANGGGNGVTNSTLLTGAQITNQGTTYLAGLGTGAETFSNVLIPNTGLPMPLGHVLQVRFLVNFSFSVANGQVGARIRYGNGTGGLQIGSGHGWGPTAGFTYELSAEGWFIGDGLAHSIGLTVQNFTGGTLSISSSAIAPGVAGVFDWGDATGVTFS